MRGRNTTGFYVRFPDADLPEFYAAAGASGRSFVEWLRYLAYASLRGEFGVPRLNAVPTSTVTLSRAERRRIKLHRT